METLRAFERRWASSAKYAARPMRLAADLHPGYHTRSWAERHTGDRPLELVQHHHAHMVSVLAEHGRNGEPIVGVAFDGTGYGCDGTIWGGEVLSSGATATASSGPATCCVPLPGVTLPCATLADGAVPVVDGRNRLDARPATGGRGSPTNAVIRSQLESGPGCVPSSSMGRLFDAVLFAGRPAAHGLRGPGRHRIRSAGRLGGPQTRLSLPLTVRADGIIDPAHHGARDRAACCGHAAGDAAARSTARSPPVAKLAPRRPARPAHCAVRRGLPERCCCASAVINCK